jgi:plasmid stabilization system protein ParE
MKIHWTETAEGHLDAIYAYIAQDSPQYAMRMVDRLPGDHNRSLIFLSPDAKCLSTKWIRFEK